MYSPPTPNRPGENTHHSSQAHRPQPIPSAPGTLSTLGHPPPNLTPQPREYRIKNRTPTQIEIMQETGHCVHTADRIVFLQNRAGH